MRLRVWSCVETWKSIISSFHSHEQFVSCKYNREIESLKSIISNFWSHKWFVSPKCDHEIKSLKSIISNFWSHEKCRNHEIKSLLQLLISWKIEKTFDLLFLSPEIWPPDPRSSKITAKKNLSKVKLMLSLILSSIWFKQNFNKL